LPATVLVDIALIQVAVVEPPAEPSRRPEIRKARRWAVSTVPEPSCKTVQLSGEGSAVKPIVRDHAGPTATDQLVFSLEQSCRIMPSRETAAS
jgi:hypothetical protein